MPAMDWLYDRNHWYKQCYKCDKEFEVVIEDGNQATAYDLMIIHFQPEYRSMSDGLKGACRSCSNTIQHKRIGTMHRADILEQQNGKCAICEIPLKINGRSGGYVDHDHVTRNERGVLCNTCNTRMSGVDDDTWLVKALTYRDTHREKVERKGTDTIKRDE